MNITFADKSTSTSEIRLCDTCLNPDQSKSTATKHSQALIPLKFITAKDLEEILFNADRRCCGNKPAKPKCESSMATGSTQDLIPLQLISAEDIEEMLLKSDRPCCGKKPPESLCETATATENTQDLIPLQIISTKDVEEILLNADRRRSGNKTAQPIVEKVESVTALIDQRFITPEDIEEIFLEEDVRRSGNKRGRCACARGSEPKYSSLHSLTAKEDTQSVSIYEDARDSFGGSSDAHSPSGSGSCSSARAQYYHNKLLATIQILQNKEETVRIQAESLAVAENRIAALTTRTAELKGEIDRKSREIQSLKEIIENSRLSKCDASIVTDGHDTGKQENIVKTLQNSLSVIEELYRECFYETAKQESIIEMLRKSYLDVRLEEREKSDQITRLNNVIDTQKWSLDRCQDIASEVDNLKIEITNFLNNSNNDSGVWEESADGVMEDLQDINTQLLHLRELLTGDCTCGLEQENKRLKQTNANLQKQVGDLRDKIDDLENILENKEKADKHFEQQILKKEKELNSIKQRLTVLDAEAKKCCGACEASTKKLHETEALLREKCGELCQMQNKCKLYEEALKTVRNEVEKYEHCNNEVCSLREENKQLQKTARSLKSRLVDAQRHAASLEECCRQESIRARELESELCEAAERGAALCEAARRAVATVKTWAALLKDKHQQQTELLLQKENQLRCLRQLLGQRRCYKNTTRESETCNPCPSTFDEQQGRNDTRTQSGSETEPHMSTSSFKRERHKEMKVQSESSMMPCCSKCEPDDSFKSVGGGQDYARDTSASEMECSSVPTPLPLWKKLMGRNGVCEAYIQRPVRSDVTTCSCDLQRRVAYNKCDVTRRKSCDRSNRRSCDTSRDVRHCTVQHSLSWSPCEEVFSRVEGAGAALSAAVRRWRRSHTHVHRTHHNNSG